MRFSLRVLGLELVSVEASTEDEAEVEEDPPVYDPIAGLGAVESTPISFESRPIDSRQTESVPAFDPWDWPEDRR